MRFTSKCFIYAALSGLGTTSPLLAQQTESTYADLEYIRSSNPWLNSENAAGLKNYAAGNISRAAIYFNKKDGGFTNYFQSDDSQEYGITAESYRRLTNKVVLAGGFGYQNFNGRNMTGSAFIDPYENPFDIVEMDVANKGTKEKELYHLNGALSAQVNNRLSIGGKMVYNAGNYAKRKDLRYTDKLLDMDLTAGATYHISDVAEIGANYSYSRRIESIGFDVAGNTDRQYLSLISYGSFYGRTELFDQYGYTSNNISPLKDIRQGAAMQLNLRFNKNVNFFNEFRYADRKGFYGEEGTSSILLTRHTGSDFSYTGQLSVKTNEAEHHIRWKGNYSFLDNKKTIYRRLATTGGVDQIVYYGDRDVFSGETVHADLNYDLYLSVKNNRPRWALNFNANYLGRNQSTDLYPYYRDQKINSYQLSGQLNRQFQRQNNAINIGLGIGYGSGNGKIAADEIVVTPAPDHLPPVTQSQFINEEFEFFTASRMKGKVMFSYTKALQNNVGVYLGLDYSYTHSSSVNYLGKYASQAKISLGCNF